MKTKIPLPPGPKPRYPGEFIIAFQKNPIELFARSAACGDISHFKMGPQSVYILNHPDLVHELLVLNQKHFIKSRGLQRAKKIIGEGLLTSEGELHLRQRRLVQPAFHKSRMESYASIMLSETEKKLEQWQDGKTTDIAHEMMAVTLNIAAKTLFGADVSSEIEEISEATSASVAVFRMGMLPFSDFLEKLPFPPMVRFRKAKTRLNQTIYRIINDRRALKKDTGDLLSMLLLAQDTEGDGGRMNDEQVRDEVTTLFLAGHETTANALSWTWYLLSQNPNAQKCLHEELEKLLGQRPLTFADLPQLAYTRAVFAEGMRLFPPAWGVGRLAVEPCTIGGYPIPVGAIALVSQFLIHRDARFFPEPLKFEPARWLNPDPSRPKYAYFPFGAGQRQCIGEQFAWIEGTLLLAKMARDWSMDLVPNHPIALDPQLTLRPKYGIQMVLRRRASQTKGRTQNPSAEVTV